MVSDSHALPTVIDANCLFGHWGRANLDASLTAVVDALSRSGIRRAVLGSLRAATYDTESGNQEALEACAATEGFIPAGAVNLRKTLNAEREVAELAARGFRLLRLSREHEGWPMDYAPLEDALRAAADHALPVMIAALLPGDLTILARLVESSGCPTIVTGVNVSHTPLLSEAVVVGRRCPLLHFETSRLEGADTIDLMAQHLGVDRLVFGAGLPFQYANSALALVHDSTLSPEQREAVLQGNIARLMGIEGAL